MPLSSNAMTSFKFTPLTLAIVLLATSSIDAKRPFSIEVLEIKSNISDVNFIKTLNHSVTNKKVGNFNVLFAKNVTEWSLNVSFDILTKSNRRLHMFKNDLDVCKVLKDSSLLNNFVSIVWKEVLRTSNLPRKCPLLENVLYSIVNYTIIDDSYPDILPFSMWQYELHLIFNKIYTADMIFKGRIRKV